MAAISCLYFGSLPFYKDWINDRLRLCYCCSALCLTLIQSWGTLVVTGKDDNCSGFSNAKFAIMSACRLSCLVTRECVTHENQNAILSLRPDRYCVSLIDPDTPQFRWGNPYFFSENLYQSVSFIYASMSRKRSRDSYHDTVCKKNRDIEIDSQQQRTKIGALLHVARQSE